ncbi:CYTH-like domain-containing protein [Talaromyces proteolyticus]|uniref:mRNA-capping enzyme subunit beta n=1 Tax=Talaromyces proteolyticus TaxID=1131652 RepID=A0AAD4Q2C3_9EURO|nr:CYTH-like domain-containing protein [Talaromyces proteolyticus]KAH8700178.1 CYTH-like domain-containing protein [Talaromyces proteolyticus]
MDLRSMLNSDANGGAKSHPSPSLQSSPARQSSEPLSTPRPTDVQTPGASSYQHGYFSRPPQPPPLQPPQHSPVASAPYSSTQSPYQYSSASSITGGPQSHHVQSPSQTYPPGHRDSHPVAPASPAVYAQPPLASPYTPQSSSASQLLQKQQQSYFAHHQGPQPLQYVPVPSSRSSHSSHASESPHSAHVQQTFPPQRQFSPHPQRSQPGTPLGPPSAPYQRLPPQSVQPLPTGDPHQAHPTSPWGSQDIQGPELKTRSSPSRHTASPSRQVEQPYGQYPAESDRERSVSVSPKTIVSRQSLSQDQRNTPHRTSADEERWRDSPPASHSHSSYTAEHSKRQSLTPQQVYPQPPQAMQTSSSPLARNTPSRETPTAPSRPIKSEFGQTSSPPSGRPPKRKKIRYDEPPIYARKVTRMGGKGPVIPNPRPPIPKHSLLRSSLQDHPTIKQEIAAPPTSVQTPVKPLINGPVNGATPPNGRVLSTGPPEPVFGPLGPWEPSITGKIPYEEVTKAVCDFLFKEVVLRKDLAAGAAGASASGSAALVEIEAKLGRIIDKDRGERLRLPILTECVIQREASGLRTVFESSMSLAQHRAMNNFLNEAVKHSMPQSGSNRIPLSYAHKRERDTFYEISPNELPPVIQHHLHPRHKPKVRMTTDQKTGEIIAKIVKCRLADLDVYSPQTNVDWRISVNLEMNFDGEVQHLQVSDGGGARGRGGSDRIKDRMSYRHLAYQIDLTQVGTAEGVAEHELEVEISAAEVRRQGNLAMNRSEANQYEDLIKGFVDNVRVLARSVPNA